MKTKREIRPSLFRSRDICLDDLKLSVAPACFADGYTDEDMNRALDRLYAITGIELGVLWGYYDSAGFGGDSDFVVCFQGRIYEIADGMDVLSGYLFHGEPAPERIEIKPGPRLRFRTQSGHNYATRVRGE